MGRELPASDGRQDQRPWIRCSGCQQLALCYMGPLIEMVEHPTGPIPRHSWICSRCMAEAVGEAIRRSDVS